MVELRLVRKLNTWGRKTKQKAVCGCGAVYSLYTLAVGTGVIKAQKGDGGPCTWPAVSTYGWGKERRGKLDGIIHTFFLSHIELSTYCVQNKKQLLHIKGKKKKKQPLTQSNKLLSYMCRQTDAPGGYHSKWIKQVSEKQMSSSYLWAPGFI